MDGDIRLVPQETAPKEPELFTAEWFAGSISANEANLRLHQATVAELERKLAEEKQLVERITGAVDAIRMMQGLKAQGQG